MPEIILSTAQPGLFASDRFLHAAGGLGIDVVSSNPYDMQKVVHLARHKTLPSLGALMLHGPDEGNGNKKTAYYHLSQNPNSSLSVGSSVSKTDINAAANEEALTVLSLKGADLTEEELSLALYRSARAWRDPNPKSLRPDAWLGFVGGGALGLAVQVIRVGLEEAPADLAEHGKAIIIGAVIGGLAKPVIAAARLHYDRPAIKERRPIILGRSAKN